MTLVQINKKAALAFDEVAMKQFCRLQVDQMWIISHKEQLRKTYTDEYIAVQNQSVCFVAKDIENLISNILKNNKQVDDFAIDFIGKYPANLLL
jgi:hypothetical protein